MLGFFEKLLATAGHVHHALIDLTGPATALRYIIQAIKSDGQ